MATALGFVVLPPGPPPARIPRDAPRFPGSGLDDALIEAARLSCGEDDEAPQHQVAVLVATGDGDLALGRPVAIASTR